MKRLILILALALSLLLISCASTDGSAVTGDSTDTSADSGSAANNDTATNEGTNSDIGAADSNGSDSTDTDSAVQDGDNGTQSKGGEVSSVNEFILKARVLGKNETHLEVEVIESDYAFGTYWVIVPSSTPILSAQGETLSLNDLSAGAVVEITYNGQTMMSYPPQIVALSINVK